MNSILNPEAPEYYPNLTSVTKGAFTSVQKSIKSSNNLSVSQYYFRTIPDFNDVTSHISDNLVKQSNDIVVTEFPKVQLKRNDKDYNTEKIIDTNDNILDRVNVNIDEMAGVNKRSDISNCVNTGGNASSLNRPVISKIKMGSTTFFGAKNIPRPQFNFTDKIDNSESLWVPKISDKPNNIKPLSLTILYNEDGEIVGYEHPYKVELNQYQPPYEFIKPDPNPPVFPPSLEVTKFTFIETEAQIDELVTHLNEVKEIAVDLEHHSYRTYQGITCLMQISTNEGGDFIIDTLAVRDHIHKLNLAFTDSKKLKVLHGANSDVLWLQRDFGVYIVGMFDTHQAAKVLQLPALSLKNLLNVYCRVDTDKKHSLADWRMRPLPEELIEYARLDTHYLIYIWRRMKEDLLKLGCGQPHYLLSAFEQSKLVCAATYKKPVVDETSHMSLYMNSKKTFDSKQLTALQMLYKWRDTQARALDESTGYLLPNHMLLALAENLPREVQGVNACCIPMPPVVKQNLMTIHSIILSCREFPSQPQLYQMPAGIRKATNAAASQSSVEQYNTHDRSQQPDFRDDQQLHLGFQGNYTKEIYYRKNIHYCPPDVSAFKTRYGNNGRSTSNVASKQYLRPYVRYRKYRYLAQAEETKEFKEKEAKISAISKGDQLTKQEILIKLRTAHIGSDTQDNSDNNVEKNKDSATQCRRKIFMEKGIKNKTKSQLDNEKPGTSKLVDKKKASGSKSKELPFHYHKTDYNMFYNEV